MDTTATVDLFRKAVNLTHVTIKASKKAWIVEGFASTDAVDHTFDKVPLSGLRSLAKTLKNQTTVLFNHNPDHPIGKLLAVKVKETPDGLNGLFVRLEISKSEPGIWQKIQDGTINKFSWSGMVQEFGSEFDEDMEMEITLLKKIKALEVSLVSIPANNTAAVTDVRIGKFLNGEIKMGTMIKESTGLPNTKSKAGEDAEPKGEDLMDIDQIIKDLNVDELNDEQKKSLVEKLGIELVNAGDTDNSDSSDQDADSTASGDDTNKDAGNTDTAKSSVADIRKDVKDLTDVVKGLLPKDEECDEDVANLHAEVTELKGIVTEAVKILKKVPLKKGRLLERGNEDRDETPLIETKEFQEASPEKKARLLLEKLNKNN